MNVRRGASSIWNGIGNANGKQSNTNNVWNIWNMSYIEKLLDYLHILLCIYSFNEIFNFSPFNSIFVFRFFNIYAFTISFYVSKNNPHKFISIHKSLSFCLLHNHKHTMNQLTSKSKDEHFRIDFHAIFGDVHLKLEVLFNWICIETLM